MRDFSNMMVGTILYTYDSKWYVEYSDRDNFRAYPYVTKDKETIQIGPTVVFLLGASNTDHFYFNSQDANTDQGKIQFYLDKFGVRANTLSKYLFIKPITIDEILEDMESYDSYLETFLKWIEAKEKSINDAIEYSKKESRYNEAIQKYTQMMADELDISTAEVEIYLGRSMC